jgi:hypothetical protein
LENEGCEPSRRQIKIDGPSLRWHDWAGDGTGLARNRCQVAINKRRTNMAITPSASLDKRETVSLIGSDKVEGTAVYRSNGEKAGTIQRVMIDKIGGKVAYAVMSFGGFMGIGEDYYPLPWSVLTYNPKLDGYEVNITEQQLKGAPKYGRHDSWDWSDRTRGQKIYDYYGVTPYWS